MLDVPHVGPGDSSYNKNVPPLGHSQRPPNTLMTKHDAFETIKETDMYGARL